MNNVAINTNSAPNNNILAIASGKGGVGKTWFAITMAHLFARSGRRVLLFDGDIGLANVDVQLGLTPKKDLGSAILGKCTLAETITSYEAGGFDIIAGRSGSASLAALPVNRLEGIKKELLQIARNYDYVILDLGAGVEQYVQYLSAIASRCMVLLTDEPTSLTDAYAFIKMCLSRDNMPELMVVINQAATQKEGEKSYAALHKACSSFLSFSPPCLGIIRKDGKVKEAIRSQRSLLSRAPHSTAATDAAAISIKLMQR